MGSPPLRHAHAEPAAVLRAPGQLGLDLDGQALSETTFCVVDLETTGGSHVDGRITEIGAVRIRGGAVLGEFQTFVNPGQPIPAFISVLTGITDGMVASAPREQAAVPMLLDFMAGAVFVAHNAPFDTGFLKAACERLGLEWPRPQTIDTARLARSVLTRDEVPNHKLATLARFFGADTEPNHRALEDARATVDVLHGLLERVGSLGVLTLEELAGSLRKVPEARRRKRHLADRLPECHGVYVFRDGEGKALYVGVSTNVRKRVQSYFTASEQRHRMTEMVGIAESVTAVPCQTDLEARIRELRMIADLAPPYNRRARHPERCWWLKLTVEAFPRLSMVRAVAADGAAGAAYIGPYSTRKVAERAAQAFEEAFSVRTCRTRIRPGRPTADCALAEMDRCLAPCRGELGVDDYGHVAVAVRAAMTGDAGLLVAAVSARMDRLSEAARFEEAALWRDRLADALQGIESAAHLHSLGRIEELVAAQPRDGGWDIHIIRHGRLAGAAHAPRGTDPRIVARACRTAAAAVQPPNPPAAAASPAETRLLLGWLSGDGVQLVSATSAWSLPLGPRPDEFRPAAID